MDEEYMDSDLDEDFSHLEDAPEMHDEDSDTLSVVDGDHTEPLDPDTPIYRLRLSYSHESFLAAFPGQELVNGTVVLVPTRYGRDLAQVIGRIHNTNLIKQGELVRIEHIAGESDLAKAAEDTEKEAEAFTICRQKIETHKLDMKLVSVHYLLEEPKILFFFTAENRVDFRELVKDLVSIFKTRIELRQIGVRDESRVVGGLGVCGRGYCCHTVSDKLKPVSIKMAKDQNLSLNSMKISGPCGRLLCCLAYEHSFYNEQRRKMPPEGCKIPAQGTVWKVIEINPVSDKVRVASEDGRQLSLPVSIFDRNEGGRWRILEEDLAEYT